MWLSTSGPDCSEVRRRFVLSAGCLVLLGALWPRWVLAAAAADYAGSIAALKEGIVAERGAHHRYVAFARHAKGEGYAGLAYLYTALASSELIHAQNYLRTLAMFDESAAATELGEVPSGSAKDNLIYAAERELNSIEEVYPALLRAVEAEGHADAIAVIRYSWASHKQHLDLIEKIRRWSPGFFESVARQIDEKTDRYFVCQVCGSTVAEEPKEACPVCAQPASSYRLVAHDRFFE
jgi:rubrerythrin